MLLYHQRLVGGVIFYQYLDNKLYDSQSDPTTKFLKTISAKANNKLVSQLAKNQQTFWKQNTTRPDTNQPVGLTVMSVGSYPHNKCYVTHMITISKPCPF
jgi:hypothetical protein